MIGMRKAGIILATAALAATAAFAQVKQQQPVSALKGHNSNAPVDVTADRIEVQDRADRAIFAGNVHVVQAEMTLDAPRLTVAYSGGGGTDNNVQIRRLPGQSVEQGDDETAEAVNLNRLLETFVERPQKRLPGLRSCRHSHVKRREVPAAPSRQARSNAEPLPNGDGATTLVLPSASSHGPELSRRPDERPPAPPRHGGASWRPPS